MRIIGVISDTHGLLRPEAVAALSGVERILHAGDIGSADVLTALRRLAPVTAVRGNNDKGPWAGTISESASVKIEGHSIHILHDIADLRTDPAELGHAVVVSGHSHRPSIRREHGVLFLNPGSAGPRRFKLPVSVAKLKISRRAVRAEILELRIR